MKVIFSGTGSGTGIGIGIGKDVVTVLCLFFAAGHFAEAEQMNSVLSVWVSYNRNENKRCVLYIVQNLRTH